MGLDGPSSEVKRLRDLLVAEAQCDEREHDTLSLGEGFSIVER